MSKITYVLYEAEFHSPKGVVIISATTLAKKYGLRMSGCKVVKLGRPQDEPINDAKTAYIHLYPQIIEENYIKIKKTLINI